ncbi:MAG: AraC family transcriptional regulator [Eubacterium sp.]|nr:AraC family transcriptional regulator [Eubacterium sp.]
MNDKQKQFLERTDLSWSSDSVRLINTPSLTARQLFFHVQEAGSFRTSAPYFTERANLNSFLVIRTESGRGTLHYEGKTHTLDAGSVVLINCMEHHRYACMKGEDWVFTWLHFNGPTALGYYEEILRSGFRTFRDSKEAEIGSLMRDILARTGDRDLSTEAVLSQQIVSLLTLLLTQSMDSGGEGTAGALRHASPYVSKAVKICEHRFAEPLSLDEIAAEVGISKFYLAREFTRCIGMPLNEYLITARLNYAKEQLRYTGRPVADIAVDAGFRQVSHFISLFKKHEKTTPLQYRNHWA